MTHGANALTFNTGAVRFNGTAEQTVSGTTGLLTFGSNATLTNANTSTTSATVSFLTQNVNIAGSVATGAGTFRFVPTATGAVTFNNTAAQTVSGAGTVTFGPFTTLTRSTAANLTFANTTTNIAGNVSNSTGTLLFNPATAGMVAFNGSGTGGQTVSGTGPVTFGANALIMVSKSGGSLTFTNTTTNIANNVTGGTAPINFAPTVAGNVTFNSTTMAQTVNGTGLLTFSSLATLINANTNAGGLTFNHTAINIAGAVTAGSTPLTFGAVTPPGGAVTFNGNTAQTVSGTSTVAFGPNTALVNTNSAGLTFSNTTTTIGDNVLTGGNLTFNPTVTTGGAVTFNGTGTAAQTVSGAGTLTFGPNATLTNANTTAPITVTNSTVSIVGNVASGTSTSTLVFNPASAGTVTFSGATARTVSGSGTVTFGFLATLAVTNTAGLTFTNTNTNIAGNVTDAAGTLAFTPSASGTVSFNGTTAQTISGPNRLVFGSNAILEINNMSNVGVTLQRPVLVNRRIMFTAGLLNTSAANILTLPTSANITATGSTNTTVSNASFVNGPVRRTTATGTGDVLLDENAGAGLFFPIGTPRSADGTTGGYRPITLQMTQLAPGVSTAYIAQVVLGTPPAQTFPTPATETSIKRVSTVRYYSVTSDNASPFTDGRATIYYGLDDKVDAPSKLRIAKSQASGAWANLGGGAATTTNDGKTALTGFITSSAAPNADAAPDAPFTSVGNFVLATTDASFRPGSNPLPVELTAFTAAPQPTGIILDWATATEKNSATFEVQRSADVKTFETIATVQAQGSSSTQHAYSSLDRAPLAGISYYRLRQLDKDGTAAYSSVVSVRWTGAAQETSVKVYPNPSTGTLYLSGVAGQVPYRVLNSQGQVLLAGQTTGEAGVDLRRLPAGLYLLHMTTEKGTVVRRFVRQ